MKNIYNTIKKRYRFFAIAISMLIVTSSMMVGFTINSQDNESRNNTTDNIHINVDGCNIKIEKSIDDEFHYNYNLEKYSLSTSEDDNILNIQVDGKGIGAWVDIAIISILERWYDTITVIGDKAGITLPSGIDADFSITSNNGAIGISVDEDFSRNIDFSCIDSSGSIDILETATNYTLNINGKDNAIINYNKNPIFSFEKV